MIYYDSHKSRTLLGLRGSVFPKAMLSAVLVTLICYVIKLLEVRGHLGIDLKELQLVDNSAVYSGFSFTLGFILVFRTSQSYNRFWVSATSVNAMKAQWVEAAAGLVTFAEMSTFDRQQILTFQHQIVRLFSMLHATALSAIASMDDERFMVLGLDAFDAKDLDYMYSKKDLQKVEVVYQWIQTFVVNHMSNGFLNVPPPILTRVFQEMEKGMIEFNSVNQIMQIPFPFPYAQVTYLLILVHAVLTPFVMCLWTSTAWCAAVFTFISHLSIVSINMIATELENPFGDDINDLPVHEFHDAYNDSLTLLLDPRSSVYPKIKKGTKLDLGSITEFQRCLSPDDNAVDRSRPEKEDRLEKEAKLGQSEEPMRSPEDPFPCPPAHEAPTELRVEEKQQQLVQQLLVQLLQHVQETLPVPGDRGPTEGAAPSGQLRGMAFSSSAAGLEEFFKKQDVAHRELLSALTQMLNRLEDLVPAPVHPAPSQWNTRRLESPAISCFGAFGQPRRFGAGRDADIPSSLSSGARSSGAHVRHSDPHSDLHPGRADVSQGRFVPTCLDLPNE